MKLNFLVLLLLGGLASFSPAVIADDGFEEIESELLDRSVVMQLPEGVRRIRMQVRDDAGLWVTHTIAHLNGGEGFLKLRLPDGVSEDDIEIAASWSDPFPFEFYAGGSKFDPTQSDGSNDRTGAPELSGGITDDSESATVCNFSSIRCNTCLLDELYALISSRATLALSRSRVSSSSGI